MHRKFNSTTSIRNGISFRCGRYLWEEQWRLGGFLGGESEERMDIPMIKAKEGDPKDNS